MQSKQGRTLPLLGLSEGCIGVTSGIYKGATTFYCVEDGELGFSYHHKDRTVSDDIHAFKAGESFGVQNLEYIKVISGTFHVGYD